MKRESKINILLCFLFTVFIFWFNKFFILLISFWNFLNELLWIETLLDILCCLNSTFLIPLPKELNAGIVLAIDLFIPSILDWISFFMLLWTSISSRHLSIPFFKLMISLIATDNLDSIECRASFRCRIAALTLAISSLTNRNDSTVFLLWIKKSFLNPNLYHFKMAKILRIYKYCAFLLPNIFINDNRFFQNLW